MINFEFLPGGNIIYHFWKVLYEIKLEKKYCCMKSNMELDVIDVKNYTYNNTNIITDEESKRYFYGLDGFWDSVYYVFQHNKLSDLVILKFEIKENYTSFPITISKIIYAHETYPPYLSDYIVNCYNFYGEGNNIEYAYIPYITFGQISILNDYPITSYGIIFSPGMRSSLFDEGGYILPNIKTLTYIIAGKKKNNENVNYSFPVSFDNLCVNTCYENCRLCSDIKRIKGCSHWSAGGIQPSNLNSSSCFGLIYNYEPYCWSMPIGDPLYFRFEYLSNTFIYDIEDVYIILESLSGKKTIDTNMPILLGFEGNLMDCEDICNAKSNNLLPLANNIKLFRIRSIDGTNYLIQRCCSCS